MQQENYINSQIAAYFWHYIMRRAGACQMQHPKTSAALYSMLHSGECGLRAAVLEYSVTSCQSRGCAVLRPKVLSKKCTAGDTPHFTFPAKLGCKSSSLSLQQISSSKNVAGLGIRLEISDIIDRFLRELTRNNFLQPIRYMHTHI